MQDAMNVIKPGLKCGKINVGNLYPPDHNGPLQVRVLPGAANSINDSSDKVLCRADAVLEVYAPVTQ
jgi:hypothetical protein